jgi:hypothetical protein
MPAAQEELDSFYRFATERISNSGVDVTFAELVDIWRIQHPTSDELHENVAAVKEALRDMETGETGRPFDEFASDFRKRNDIPADA